MCSACWSWEDLTLLLQRHKFTKAFALESLRTILTWRLTHLRDQDRSQSLFLPSPFHILPPPASDILRRPILVLRLAKLATLQRDPREDILRSVEGLRLNLHNINSSEDPSAATPRDGPVFQYVLLVDMEGVSMRKSVRSYFSNSQVGTPHLMTEYSPLHY
jgi:retinaldehyde-binding protein 1